MLLLHRNEAVSVDRLIDVVWGERTPANAVNNVQIHVSRLRKAHDFVRDAIGEDAEATLKALLNGGAPKTP